MVAASALALALAGGCGRPEAEPLLVYCGNSMRTSMEELAPIFGAEKGVEVEITYNDSGTLLAMIEETGKGDLYVCHDPFGGAAEVRGLASKSYTIAYLVPVIAVARGNPKGIKSFKDLLRPELKVGITSRQYSSCGHIVSFMLEKAGLAEEFKKQNKPTLESRTGGEVGNALKLGTIDAGIIWDAVAYRYRDLVETIPIETGTVPNWGWMRSPPQPMARLNWLK